MKKIVYLLMTGAVVFMGLAFTSTVEEKMPAADGEEFWSYISETSPYQQWMAWPGKSDMYPGQSPHGAYLKLYVNQKAYDAI